MTAILAFLLGIGISPIVENVPGVKQLQALVRRGRNSLVVALFTKQP